MADRTSASIFGDIFQILFDMGTEDCKVIAKEVYHNTKQYDFHPAQMACDDQLKGLGLAKDFIDTSYSEPETIVIYYPFKEEKSN